MTVNFILETFAAFDCIIQFQCPLLKLFFYNSSNTSIFWFAVPPDPPVILDSNGRRVGSLIGPYDEGETLSITCMSSKGNWNRVLFQS